jgi:hypothetical protein
MRAFAMTFIAVWIFAIFATRYPALGMGFAIIAGAVILVICCGSPFAALFHLSSLFGDIVPR